MFAEARVLMIWLSPIFETAACGSVQYAVNKASCSKANQALPERLADAPRPSQAMTLANFRSRGWAEQEIMGPSRLWCTKLSWQAFAGITPHGPPRSRCRPRSSAP
jgi:hypothetical protein